MPTRILRDTTDSEKVNSISIQAEVMFYRLFMKADDFGRFYGNPKLLKANLFPLRMDTIRDSDITRWLTECETAGLILVYTVAGKTYLEIKNFGQRLRTMKSKFPGPSDDVSSSPQVADNCRPDRIPISIPKHTDIETETDTDSGPPPADIYSDFIKKFNQITGKTFAVLKGKSKSQFESRLKDGFTLEQMLIATKNCHADPFHQQNPKYLTPEFITRPDKLENYLNYQQSKTAATGNGFPNCYDRDFEKKIQGAQLSAYWSHLRSIGFEPVRNGNRIVGWAERKAS